MTLLPLAMTIILAANPVIDDSARYDVLKRQAMAQDEGTDFAALRFATAERPDYDPFFPVSAEFKEALVLVKEGRSEEALETCENLTSSFFVSIPLHQACTARLAALGESGVASVHRFLAHGLLLSLEPDDSGVTTVINVDEEYDLAKLKGYRVIGHAKRMPKGHEGHPLSSLKVVDEDGREFWVNFRKHAAYETFQRNMIRRALEREDE